MSARIKFPWTLIKNLQLSRQNFTQNQCESKKRWRFNVRKFAFEWSGYNKYGLYTHDVIDYTDPVVYKALRRLPMDILDARNFRIIRALQLSFLKIYLPKEKWVTYEQDLEYRYLSTYMEEIKAEQAEINEFDCHNYDDSLASKVK
ncbi:cytochrome b-c1 complex subunit 7-like [Nylanderia fulva]|uniref:cytochrome b-c1 complex subunit 7-like n=1 Tax=Nylanderia fulva TaxID=613905 RepID=UPI0010FB416D|nr:cytochrome b-c1 complex subunit 7-like [Nylanderia fulva]